MTGELEVANDQGRKQADGVGGNGIAKARDKLLRHGRAPQDAVLLQNHDALAGTRQVAGADETVMAAADDRNVEFSFAHAALLSRRWRARNRHMT